MNVANQPYRNCFLLCFSPPFLSFAVYYHDYLNLFTNSTGHLQCNLKYVVVFRCHKSVHTDHTCLLALYSAFPISQCSLSISFQIYSSHTVHSFILYVTVMIMTVSCFLSQFSFLSFIPENKILDVFLFISMYPLCFNMLIFFLKYCHSIFSSHISRIILLLSEVNWFIVE